ncbi:MAG: hypothetical protein KAI08_12910 [Bacteroidales bacterium]|nr:hypothetical protein [Bacteroidales bacterium]
MRTIKITLITALIAMGAILYGQAHQVKFTNASYAEESSRFENLVQNYLCLTDRSERQGYNEPVVFMSYTVDLANVVYEEHYGTEPWMTTPFESSVAEADLSVEEWMTRPFGSSVEERKPTIEKWMTIPFEAAEHIAIESWMTAAF